MDRIRDLARRLADLGVTFFDTFVRDNRVLPPVAALLALFLFAWVVAGAFINEPEEGDTSGQAELVQSRDPSGAPEVEDRDADSYAAYRNKDPFRQLLAPAEAQEETTNDGSGDDGSETPEDTTGEGTDETTASPPPAGTPPGGTPPGGTPPGGTPGGGTPGAGNPTTRNDSDGDGIPNRREERLGLDPRDPDSDGDGTPDGQDDADGDGVPDGQAGPGGGGAGAGGGGAGAGAGAGGGAGTDDELFDSGGYAP